MNTIKNFHLDKKRSGDIFKCWLKEAGLTYHECAEETGIPYDTLNNTLNGKNELGVERALKLCVITRHTFSEYMQALCEGYDNVDFADELRHVIAPPNGDYTSRTDGSCSQYKFAGSAYRERYNG